MDRIEAMRVFVAAVDEGSLAGASRKLSRSAAAVSRALAFLEAHVGAPLLHRTTRSIRLSTVGERYAAACRRVLAELEEADMLATCENAAPRGLLSLMVPVAAGDEILRPVLDAFLMAYPRVSMRLLALNRQLSLVETGVDVALQIGHLTSSSLVAVRIGEVKHVLVASPRYLARHPRIDHPGDLARHEIIAVQQLGVAFWGFPAADGLHLQRVVQLSPRLIVDSVRAAVVAAVDGCGITRLYSHHIAEEVAAGELQLVLAQDEQLSFPVYLVSPPGRLAVPKVRAFMDFAVPRLRARLARLSATQDEACRALPPSQQTSIRAAG